MIQTLMSKNIYLEEEGISGSPIYYQPWWLDIVCKKGGWDVSLHLSKEGKILGVLPYFITSIFGMKVIRTPPFTPTLGVWLDYSNCSDRNVNRYGFEMETITALVKQLPEVASYHQIHPFQFQNWLPFYWRGFEQTTRYTYVLEDLDLETVWRGMKDKLRNTIKKAEREGVFVRVDDDLEKLLKVCRDTFQRQGLNSPYESQIQKSLHHEIQARQQGKIYSAVDEKGNTHAGMYLIWDEETAYCWMLGANTELRSSGAVQLLLLHAIQEASQFVKKFNFEGSMLPHIEPVFRAFGAERKPIFQIRKFRNPLFKLMWWLLNGRSQKV